MKGKNKFNLVIRARALNRRRAGKSNNIEAYEFETFQRSAFLLQFNEFSCRLSTTRNVRLEFQMTF